MPDKHYIDVAGVEDISEKSFQCFSVGEVKFVLAHFRDEFFAVENQCSHALATFDEGRMRGYRIMCPLHGATFDLRDGSATGAPATRPLRTYPLRIVNERIQVDLSAGPSDLY